MYITVCFYLALAVVTCCGLSAIVLYNLPYKRGRILSPSNLMLAGVFVSSVLLFFPINVGRFATDTAGFIQTLLLSVLRALKLFVLDGDFDLIPAFSAEFSDNFVRTGYPLLGTVLYILSPALSVGFVLSFFKNLSAYVSCLMHTAFKMYVFSRLNEQSVLLAESIKEKHPRSFIVFTDVVENGTNASTELLERARVLKATCFKKSIVDINWRFHLAEAFLFAIDTDEEKNIEHAILLRQQHGARKRFRLYVFTAGAESDILFNTSARDGMNIRRIHTDRALISRTLYSNGHALFENALDHGSNKLISVVLVGLGKYGTEMLKALSWFCQMDGYELYLHVIDKDPDAKDKLSARCKELLDPGSEKAHYHINIHSGVDIEKEEFAVLLQEIREITHVYIALGSDALNIRAALNVRLQCERNRVHPQIHAIVHDPIKSKALQDMKDYRGNLYNIDFFGDLSTSFSENVIINSELEQLALERHLKWGKESDFWAYEFNYNSSIATAIHMKARQLCNIPGAHKRDEELTEEERKSLEILEHRRWNAYMRSEGYIYSGSTDKDSRNDLAKMHHNIVDFDELTEEDKRKDSRVGTV